MTLTKKLFLISLITGLGFGGGIIYLLYLMDTSFRKPEEVEALFGASVIAIIPTILHKKQRILKHAHHAMTIFFVLISITLFFSFVFILLKGSDQFLSTIKNVI